VITRHDENVTMEHDNKDNAIGDCYQWPKCYLCNSKKCS